MANTITIRLSDQARAEIRRRLKNAPEGTTESAIELAWAIQSERKIVGMETDMRTRLQGSSKETISIELARQLKKAQVRLTASDTEKVVEAIQRGVTTDFRFDTVRPITPAARKAFSEIHPD